MPESPPLFARSQLLTWPQKLRVLGEYFVPARRDDADESLRDFGNRRLGKGFTSVFLDAMAAGIYGSTPDRISVRAAFPLIAALEREHGGLFRGMLAKRKQGAGPGGVLTSTVRGIGSMTGHLRDAIAARLAPRRAGYEPWRGTARRLQCRKRSSAAPTSTRSWSRRRPTSRPAVARARPGPRPDAGRDRLLADRGRRALAIARCSIRSMASGC